MRTFWTALSALTALGLVPGHHPADASPPFEGRARTGRAACRPFQRELTISLGARKNSASFRVPAGKRLAIEYLSVHGELPFGQNLLVELQTTLHGITATHFSVPSRLD
ncbi:MAG: hypothetical protein NZM33_11795 [Bryobacteraceae bacterium]|nr:hypothetical protein [Bryobacteraceae bacterium]